jgi:hypothetical protein
MMMETILTTVLTPAIRHGLTVAAGALVAMGLVDPAQQGNFVVIGTGIVLGAIGFGWSLTKNRKK